jgi:hypothetical protein
VPTKVRASDPTGSTSLDSPKSRIFTTGGASGGRSGSSVISTFSGLMSLPGGKETFRGLQRGKGCGVSFFPTCIKRTYSRPRCPLFPNFTTPAARGLLLTGGRWRWSGGRRRPR